MNTKRIKITYLIKAYFHAKSKMINPKSYPDIFAIKTYFAIRYSPVKSGYLLNIKLFFINYSCLFVCKKTLWASY